MSASQNDSDSHHLLFSRSVLSRIVLLCAVAVASAAAGCGVGDGTQGNDAIVAAFYPLAYAAGQVAGPGAEVVNLTAPGAEPHDLELTPREVGRVRDARLAVFSGGRLPASGAACGRGKGAIRRRAPRHRSAVPGTGGTRSPRLRSTRSLRRRRGIAARRRHARGGGWPGLRGPFPRSRIPAGLAHCGTTADRHEPCGVRLPRGPLRAPAVPPRRSPAGGRAGAEDARLVDDVRATGAT